MIDEALLEKLRRVKALADDSNSEHECQTALLMFQKLLKKHGLSERDVPIEETAAEEEIKTAKAYENTRIPLWVRHLYCMVAKHFCCVAINNTSRCWRVTHQTLTFVGHESDASIAQAAFEAAYCAAQRMCDEEQANVNYIAKCFGKRKDFNRLDYLMGFVMGMNAAYSKQEAENETGLIITTPADVLLTVEGLPSETHRVRQPRSNEAVSAGYVDGNNVGRGDTLCAT